MINTDLWHRTQRDLVLTTSHSHSLISSEPICPCNSETILFSFSCRFEDTVTLFRQLQLWISLLHAQSFLQGNESPFSKSEENPNPCLGSKSRSVRFRDSEQCETTDLRPSQGLLAQLFRRVKHQSAHSRRSGRGRYN